MILESHVAFTPTLLIMTTILQRGKAPQIAQVISFN